MTEPETPTPTPELPAAQPWEPGSGEVTAELKLAVTRVVEALGTVPRDAPDPSERLDEVGADPALAEDAGSLIPPGEPAVTDVVYPQLGGLETDTASVMVVARQTWLQAGEPVSRMVTADVRLDGPEGERTVSGIRPVEYDSVGSASLPGSLRAAVDQGQIELPEAAAADLVTADIYPGVVESMAGLAEKYEYSVSVVRSGHPDEVFGTDRLSNHTRGRAVDVWAIDGVPVAELDRNGDTLRGFLEDAARWGADSIGGPVDLDGGPGGTYFSDTLHHDHVHIAFHPPSRNATDDVG